MSRHTKTITRSFAGGEMSPEMFSRGDDAKFQAGAETLLNCIPRATGSVARRSGTRLVREIRDSTKTAHLFSFIFSSSESMVIEGSRADIGGVDSGYFRFHTDGGSLLFDRPTRRFREYADVPSYQATSGFGPFRSCSVAAGGSTFTSVGHGFTNEDIVQFVGATRSIPDGFTGFFNYYVTVLTTDTFTLSTGTPAGSAVSAGADGGYNPTIYHAGWTLDDAWANVLASEHQFQNGDPIYITMWPDGDSPTVTSFSGSTFTPAAGTNPIGLATTATVAQQVMFVRANASTDVLPPNVVEGKLYWATAHSGGVYTLSETFAGPPFDVGGTHTGTIRLAVMPEIYGGGPGNQGEFGCLQKAYAEVVEGNLLKIELSKGAGGMRFNRDAPGAGPFRLHPAFEKGDIVSYEDAAGSDRHFYCVRSWWDGEDTITSAMHGTGGLPDGTRVPGSGVRTTAQQAQYWQELPGRSTTAPMAVSSNEYAASTDITLTYGGTEHGLQTGQQVAFVAGTPPTASPALALNAAYYVIRDSATTFRIATSKANADAGTAIEHSAATPINGGLLVQSFVTAESDKVRWFSHGLSAGDAVVFDTISTSTLGGVTAGTVYYARDIETNYFKLATSALGPAITFTGDLLAVVGDSVYEVPHTYTEAELPLISTTQSADVMTMVTQDHPVTELRRLAASRWQLVEPEFTAAIAAPTSLRELSKDLGEGAKISEVGYDTNTLEHYWKVVASTRKHRFAEGNPVYISGFPSSGNGSLADGYYIAGYGSGVGNEALLVYLRAVEDDSLVKHSGGSNVTVLGLNGRIRQASLGEDTSNKYVVTAVDKNNEESSASETLEVDNLLFVEGAWNTLGWNAVDGAERYRIYKDQNGLFGLIGETDELEFRDDNIGPDLGVAPPIPDTSLRKSAEITFDATGDTVDWTDHGLEEGVPVVFTTTDRMPGVEEGKTYYALNVGENEFQLTTDPDTDTAVNITGTDTGTHTAVGGHFPATATYFEGRRVFGGSRVSPQDIWMTASGTESDLTYSIPSIDSDRIYFRVASREVSEIRHLVPMSQLVMLSDSTEYRLTPVNDDALTPSSISVRPQSYVGCSTPPPSLVNNTVVFAAARGGHVRELGYNRDVLGYLTGDLSIRAGHLFDGYTISDQTYSKAPLPVVWCVSSSGKLLGLTYIPEESVGAWHQHTTGASGVFESVTSVPEGDEDAVYVIVKRYVNGAWKRFVERFADEFRGDTADLPDAYFVDCGLTYDGASTTTISGLDHLEGESVDYLADGVAGTGIISSGTLTLSTAATKVHVGLGFTTKIKTLPLSMLRVDAFGSGRQKNVNQVWVRVFQSGAFKAGPTEGLLRASRTPASGALVDDLVQVSLAGSWDDDGQVHIHQDAPLPLTVSGVTIEVASGG